MPEVNLLHIDAMLEFIEKLNELDHAESETASKITESCMIAVLNRDSSLVNVHFRLPVSYPDPNK